MQLTFSNIINNNPNNSKTTTTMVITNSKCIRTKDMEVVVLMLAMLSKSLAKEKRSKLR